MAGVRSFGAQTWEQKARLTGAADFEVREDGQPQKVELFIEGDASKTVPLHLGLVLDTSESMERDLGAAATASIQFVNAVEESADATLDFLKRRGG